MVILKAIDLRDVLALVGSGLTGVGLWMIFPPAALIAAGVSMTAIAVWPIAAKKRGS